MQALSAARQPGREGVDDDVAAAGLRVGQEGEDGDRRRHLHHLEVAVDGAELEPNEPAIAPPTARRSSQRPSTLKTTSRATQAPAGRRGWRWCPTAARRAAAAPGLAASPASLMDRRSQAPRRGRRARDRRSARQLANAYALSYLATSALACSISLPPSRSLSFTCLIQPSVTGSRGRDPLRLLLLGDGGERVAALLDPLEHERAGVVPHVAGQLGELHARVLVDGRLEVRRQAVVLGLVHGQEEARRIEASASPESRCGTSPARRA